MKAHILTILILCSGLCLQTANAASEAKVSTIESQLAQKKRSLRILKKIKKRWQKRIKKYQNDLTPNEKTIQRKARLGWAFGLGTLILLLLATIAPLLILVAVGSLLLSIYFSISALRTIKKTDEGHQFEKLAKNGFRMAILPLAIMFVLIGWAVGFGAW
jgi:Flp pilus assembly protein TadB